MLAERGRRDKTSSYTNSAQFLNKEYALVHGHTVLMGNFSYQN